MHFITNAVTPCSSSLWVFSLFFCAYSYCNDKAIEKVFPHQERIDKGTIKKILKVTQSKEIGPKTYKLDCFYDNMVNNDNNKW
jgi:hypothetical protein